MKRITRPGCALAAILSAGMSGIWAQENGGLANRKSEQLGEVNFLVSCDEAAQKEFNHAMALFHSFWFGPAIESFQKVFERDPACAMAFWGIAMMSLGNPFSWPANPEAMQAGEAALAEAERVGAKTERERGYIAALGVLFKDWENTEYRQRAVGFEEAMGEVAARYPQDDEAQILYALILDATALPSDKTYANQRKAAGILEPLFKKYPDHPGAAHYLIHTYDYAELAEKGLAPARAYARIAPSAPHALHMPSHIFSRLGLWREMVESNRASYLAAVSERKTRRSGTVTYGLLHTMDYLVFGYLQQAQDKAAKDVVAEAAAIKTAGVENLPAAYALAAIPARYALERGDWKAAAALELRPPGDLAWDRFPQAEAVSVYARGLGAARAGDVAAARKALERLQALKDTMTAAKIQYWPDQADFQIKALHAWIALGENRKDAAVQLMREATESEEASDKLPVTPGSVVPSRELLGEMLLAIDQPAQALIEFERSLMRDPNRFRAIYCAASTAEATGDRKAAIDYYSKLQTLTADHDTERPELAHAKAFLAMQ
ncbi:MAG TPA: hypothetical protein VKE72_06265 [Methylocella sp.]|nr:hypothetical protein [Methylocella sp.]